MAIAERLATQAAIEEKKKHMLERARIRQSYSDLQKWLTAQDS